SQILKTKVEFQATSSQDQFAKWAHKEISTAKVQFASLFSSLLWTLCLFHGTKITCLLYTTGLVPVSNSLDPQLSFGSLWLISSSAFFFSAVSTTVWTIVCKRALALVGAILVDTLGSSPVCNLYNALKNPINEFSSPTGKSATKHETPPSLN
ncbi:hypothetical protein PSTT_15065, partial [Puccinia striiformis]